jgi:hypothetical protein
MNGNKSLLYQVKQKTGTFSTDTVQSGPPKTRIETDSTYLASVLSTLNGIVEFLQSSGQICRGKAIVRKPPFV